MNTEHKNTIYFAVAECPLSICVDGAIDAESLFPSFTDFRIYPLADEKLVSRITITRKPFEEPLEEARLLSDISNVWGDSFDFYELNGQYITAIRSTHSPSRWFMVSSRDFSRSTIHWVDDISDSRDLLCWLVMVTFAQSALSRQTLLIHASAIEKQHEAYAFLGKSGTGKSTHARLWCQHVPGARLLNDDNPALRIDPSGDIRIYGTPWSGKTPCYRNLGAPLGALIRLRQAPYNRMHWKQGQAAFLTILPSCSALRWNTDLFSRMNDLLETLVAHVPVGELECLPVADAALLCEQAIQKNKSPKNYL